MNINFTSPFHALTTFTNIQMIIILYNGRGGTVGACIWSSDGWEEAGRLHIFNTYIEKGIKCKISWPRIDNDTMEKPQILLQ